MKKTKTLLIGVTAVAMTVAVAARAVDGDLSRLDIRFSNGRLSLEAEAVALRDVMERLAVRAGFEVRLRGAFAEEVSQSIADVPLHLAIGRILDPGRHAYVLEFAPARPGEKTRRLATVTVMSTEGEVADRKALDRDVSPVPEPRQELPKSEPIDPDIRLEAIEILEEVLLEEEDSLIREIAAEALADIE